VLFGFSAISARFLGVLWVKAFFPEPVRFG